MTVKDLITLLSQYDADREVYVHVASGREWGPAFQVTEDERGMLVLSDNPNPVYDKDGREVVRTS